MSKAPRAIRLDSPQLGEPAGAAPLRQGDLAILPESEPIDAMAPVVPVKPKRRFSWGSLFVAGLSGFLALAAGVWVENTIRALMSQNPVLGYAALVCAAIATLALLVMLARVLRDILRERKVEALRERAVAALVGGTPDEGRAIAGELVTLYKGRAQTAQGRAALQEALPQLFAARDMLTVAERSLLAPLDALATAQIAQAARRVSLVTAVSPRALVDVIFVLVACARLLRSIAGIYAGRPGTLGLLRLARQVMNHLVLTGGMAAGDAVIQ
jgi:putative membrane protein